MVTVSPVMPNDFVAEVSGVDLRSPLADDAFSAIERAFEAYAVLVFHGQPISEAQQEVFALRFGPLEQATQVFGGMARTRTFTDISNLDENGELLSDTSSRSLSLKANGLWHTDSSFKRTPARMSMLYASRVVATGGETEFADMRAAWRSLAPDLQQRVRTLVGEHDFFHSRMQVGLDPAATTPERRAQLPPVPQVLVRTSPVTGATSLYLASHLKRILGLPEAESRALIARLMAHATQPRFVYSHTWAVDDVVMWDNRCTMHRGRPHAGTEPREMRRITVMDTGPTVAEPVETLSVVGSH